MRTYPHVALGVPDVLLPAEGLDLSKWAVIACDQFTSEPEYWERVRKHVGGAPSTLDLIFPEAFLGKAGEEERIRGIRTAMADYAARGLFREVHGFLYIERQVGSRTRRGLLACLDLEEYDFTKGSKSLIRATEGTILERLPPRVKIREGAALELPHIMVLIDDPSDSVIGPVAQERARLEKLYEFELMFGSGRLAGSRVGEGRLESSIIRALESLAAQGPFCEKYGLPAGTPVLLFAMGDGNHSLATAKTIWSKAKEAAADKKVILSSPLRHALVELVNLHDPALVFEPIHRIVFGTASGRDPLQEWRDAAGEANLTIRRGLSVEEMKRQVDAQSGRPHKIGFVMQNACGLVEVASPGSTLPVGTLQNFLDVFLKNKGAREVDFVHGTDTLINCCQEPGNIGFYLPAMDKFDLFKTVILDGVLPRKTFSMGEAKEKRFYMEARKIAG